MNENVIFVRELRGNGFSGDEVARMVTRGELVRIRRGAYVRPPAESTDPFGELRDSHRRLIDATLPQLHPRAVLSHGSAAVLHGLPLFPAMLDTVHVTRDRQGGGVRRRTLRVHGSALRDVDRCVVGDLLTTSLARTVTDLARCLPYEQGVAVADAGLALRADPALLLEALDQARSWHGGPQARRVLAVADGRSESVGESFSRLTINQAGLPTPVLQLEVFDDHGVLIGRCDFAWPDRRTLGEFDGRVKYGRLRRPGETAEQAVHREKLREDALRDQGWQLARWTWDDLCRPGVIADRLTRAFARAGTPWGG
ncbi:hypothetical protein GCM10022204_14510 [Microlunatus aurantiacus]|uniref:Transcriptional regulator, AbiEi antitoxin, Type IV TA system n=1 Tax=Microlunatus aurantiacus TaxID=446786 RepID=A0ABP7D488_9ACTN